MRKRPLDEADSLRLLGIGERVRAIRSGRLSLEECAQRSGLSTGQLLQIENGTGNPTIEALVRIARAFDVPLADLVEPKPPARTHVVRAENRREVRVTSGDHVAVLLTPGIHHELTATHHELEPGQSRAVRVKSGHTFYYVITGHLQVILDDHATLLARGDTMLAPVPHVLQAPEDSGVVFLGVLRTGER